MAKLVENVSAMACMTVLLMLFNFVFCVSLEPEGAPDPGRRTIPPCTRCFGFQCSGLLMLCVGIWMRLQLLDYAGMGHESSGAALLALSFLGALVALVGILACCCTTRQYPALLYLVSWHPRARAPLTPFGRDATHITCFPAIWNTGRLSPLGQTADARIAEWN